MTKFILLAVSVTVILLAPTQANCVPALEQPFELAQPDGQTFVATQGGDEWFNWTAYDDHLIVRDAGGVWRYGRMISRKLVPSERVVGRHKAPPEAATRSDLWLIRGNRDPGRASGPEAFLSDGGFQAASGPSGPSDPLLVILVNFADRTLTYTASQWESEIFGGTGKTVRTYFDEVSTNTFTFVPASESEGTVDDGIVMVTLDYSHPDTGATTDDRNRQLTKDAIMAADPYVDFSIYDTNHNGSLASDELHVMIVPAGYEYAYGGNPTPSVWGHHWSLFAPVSAPKLDGKWVCDGTRGGGYMQFGEMHSSHQATIGVMCHELGHDLGLPDLYDTDGSSYGVGCHCLMGYGSWGRASGESYQGQSPVHLSAWCKIGLGFVTPILLASGGTYELTAAPSASYNVLKFPTTRINEYFLVENRQRSGFDAGLQLWFNSYSGDGYGGGLAVWHIDETQSSNANEARKWVDIEEANEVAAGGKDLDSKTNQGRRAHYFYGGGNVLFADSTTPGSKFYDYGLSNALVNLVGPSGSVMSCYVCLSPQATPAVTSITPSVGGTGGRIGIASIAGGTFDPAAAVKLTKAGQPDITASNLIVTPTSISCDFDLTSAAEGVWTVVVVQPCSANGYLIDGFTVASGGRAPFYRYDLNSNPGWSALGQWAYGAPTGGGGISNPYPDPTSGHTGSKVFGINLNGDYSLEVGPPEYLTMGPVSCVGLSQVQLRYWRWLNVDANTRVNVQVQASDNNMTWSNYWSNGSTAITSNSWTQLTHSLSAMDNKASVWARWSHWVAAPAALAYSGWNIDDIELWGTPANYTIEQAKGLQAQTPVCVTGVTTTTSTDVFPGEVFVQDSLPSGLRVQTTGRVEADRLVDIVGRVAQSVDGDCYLDAMYITDRGPTTPIQPLGFAVRSVGGADLGLQGGVYYGKGPNNVGLLARAFGRVTPISSTAFYIDDGSREGYGMGSPSIKLKVTVPSGVTAPPSGSYVSVTGVCRREDSAGLMVPILRARGIGDIQILQP